jgi:hypothetical protein
MLWVQPEDKHVHVKHLNNLWHDFDNILLKECYSKAIVKLHCKNFSLIQQY